MSSLLQYVAVFAILIQNVVIMLKPVLLPTMNKFQLVNVGLHCTVIGVIIIITLIGRFLRLARVHRVDGAQTGT